MRFVMQYIQILEIFLFVVSGRGRAGAPSPWTARECLEALAESTLLRCFHGAPSHLFIKLKKDSA